MKRRVERTKKNAARAALAMVIALAATSAGCASLPIPIQFNSDVAIPNTDGTVDHRSTHWEGTLDQVPAQLGKAASELSEVTVKLSVQLKGLTEVPPPGKVALKDLSPALAKYDGKPGFDFIANAKDAQNKPLTFEYVQIGVAEYDDFFKTAQEIHALVYETTQIAGQMRQVAAKVLGTAVDRSKDLKPLVHEAIATRGKPELVDRLRSFEEMGEAIGILVPEIAKKISKLVATGKQLVTSAPTSIKNPKVVTHLGLVKEGVLRSVKVIEESGELVVNFVKELKGFGPA